MATRSKSRRSRPRAAAGQPEEPDHRPGIPSSRSRTVGTVPRRSPGRSPRLRGQVLADALDQQRHLVGDQAQLRVPAASTARQAPWPAAVTNRKPSSISMMVCRTAPGRSAVPRPGRGSESPPRRRDRCSASSLVSSREPPIARPSADSTMACRIPGYALGQIVQQPAQFRSGVGHRSGPPFRVHVSRPCSARLRPCCQPCCMDDMRSKISSGDRVETSRCSGGRGSRSWGAMLACRTRIGSPSRSSSASGAEKA